MNLKSLSNFNSAVGVRVALVIAVGTALSGCSLFGNQSGAGGPEKIAAFNAITQVYAQMGAAEARRDTAGVLAYYTPDFVRIDERGNQKTRNQEQQALKMVLAFANQIQDSSHIDSLDLQSDGATVAVQQSMTLQILNPQTQKPGSMVFNATSRDFLVRSPNGWLLKRSRTLTHQSTVDGVASP